MDDVIIGKGIGNAIKYFGDRGMLGIDFDMEKHAQQIVSNTDVVIGRSKDKTVQDQLREHGMDQNQERDQVKI